MADLTGFASGNAHRDATVVSRRLLDTAGAPTATYQGTGLHRRNGAWELLELLTVGDHTRPLTCTNARDHAPDHRLAAEPRPWAGTVVRRERPAVVSRSLYALNRRSTVLAARYHRPGPPEVLQLEEIPVPLPRSGQVLVRVRATSVNGGELQFRAGRGRLATAGRSTVGVGVDFAGVVETVGDGVTDLVVGQRVWGLLPALTVLAPMGAAAEFLVIDAARLGTVPTGLDAARAVAVLVGGSTSVTALFVHGRLRAGQRVLVRGAAGGVGYVAVQLAHAAGAHVTALARASVSDAVRDLGADEVLDYRAVQPQDLGRFDLVLDTAGGSQLSAFQRLLVPGGRMLTIAPNTGAAFAAILASGVHGSRRIRFFSNNPKREDLAILSAYIERGDIRPVVATTWPLQQIAEAHRVMEAGGGLGKHVVLVG